MNVQDPIFGFEHAMAHRNLLGGMAYVPTGDVHRFVTVGLSRFTALPYVIDPMRLHSAWTLDHGQAHGDYMATLPGQFGGVFGATGGIISPGIDFVDMDFASESRLQWWTFANNQQHMNAVNVLPWQLVFPFW